MLVENPSGEMATLGFLLGPTEGPSSLPVRACVAGTDFRYTGPGLGEMTGIWVMEWLDAVHLQQWWIEYELLFAGAKAEIVADHDCLVLPGGFCLPVQRYLVVVDERFLVLATDAGTLEASIGTGESRTALQIARDMEVEDLVVWSASCVLWRRPRLDPAESDIHSPNNSEWIDAGPQHARVTAMVVLASGDGRSMEVILVCGHPHRPRAYLARVLERRWWRGEIEEQGPDRYRLLAHSQAEVPFHWLVFFGMAVFV